MLVTVIVLVVVVVFVVVDGSVLYLLDWQFIYLLYAEVQAKALIFPKQNVEKERTGIRLIYI